MSTPKLMQLVLVLALAATHAVAYLTDPPLVEATGPVFVCPLGTQWGTGSFTNMCCTPKKPSTCVAATELASPPPPPPPQPKPSPPRIVAKTKPPPPKSALKPVSARIEWRNFAYTRGAVLPFCVGDRVMLFWGKGDPQAPIRLAWPSRSCSKPVPWAPAVLVSPAVDATNPPRTGAIILHFTAPGTVALADSTDCRNTKVAFDIQTC